jgi:copper chaperone CopZ
MDTVTLKIEGMHCDGCAETVKAMLRMEPGVEASEVSYAEGTARILFDPARIDRDRLIAAIEKSGYRVAGRAG